MKEIFKREKAVILLSAAVLIMSGVLVTTLFYISRQKSEVAIERTAPQITSIRNVEQAYEKFSYVPDFGKIMGVPLLHSYYKEGYYIYAYDGRLVTENNVSEYIGIIEKWGYKEYYKSDDGKTFSVVYENTLGMKMSWTGVVTEDINLFMVTVDISL